MASHLRGLTQCLNYQKLTWLIILSIMINLSESRLHWSRFLPDEEVEIFKVCNKGSSIEIKNRLDPNLPVIYFITPTYSRREQVPELTRLAQTLLHVRNLVWLVSEDDLDCSRVVTSLLEYYQIPNVHLAAHMPYEEYQSIPRGTSNRNAALAWIKAGSPRWKKGSGNIILNPEFYTNNIVRLF